MEKFDVVVIGGGPGGYPAAIRAAQLGARVALVEKEQLGGTCLNWGCIPTKTLLAASDTLAHIKHAESLGIKVENARADYAAMVGRKNQVVEKLRGGIRQLLQGNGVTVYAGTGSFTGRNRIRVQQADATVEIEAGATILATGSTSVMPGFIPKHARISESRAFLDRTSLPQSLIILGGGVIGCEFACMAAQLGVQVTIVEMLPDILAMLDADIRKEVRRHLEQNLKVRVLTGQPMADIKADDHQVSGTVGTETITAEHLLVSIGRRPVTDGLNLAAAGLAVDAKGFLEHDACGRTKVATIYVIGDVSSGSTQLAHAATAQGIAAAETIVQGKRQAAETLIPACIFTSPEIGTVGLSEQAAQQAKQEVRIGRFHFAALGKAMAMGDTTGFVKWIVDPRTDRLLGAQAVGPHATELIAEATVAVRAELTAVELGRSVHCHPTLSEAWMEAAHAVHGTCIHGMPKRKPKA